MASVYGRESTTLVGFARSLLPRREGRRRMATRTPVGFVCVAEETQETGHDARPLTDS